MILKNEDITDILEEIKFKLNKEKDIRQKERLMFLYLIKSGQCTTLTKVGKILCKNRATMKECALKYKKGGLEELLKRNTSNGVPGILVKEELYKLNKKLKTSEGFISYEGVRVWIQEEFNKEMTYKGVFNLCKYKLKSSLKVPRPSNPNQNKEKFEEFKKNIKRENNRSKI